MKGQWRKRIAVLMIAVLSVGVVLSGCSGNNSNSAQDQSAEASQAASQEPESSPSGDSGTESQPATAALPLNPPVVIKTYGCEDGTPLPEGNSVTDNVFTRWAKDKLGVDIQRVWTAPTQDNACVNKMRLELASGNKLPDVIFSYDYTLLQDFIATGQFQEIQPNFDQLASDTLKSGYQQHPEAWNVGKIDGKQMILPFLATAYQNDPVLWIRKDWMDKLGLQPPKTMSDLENMMEAFKNSDPDGNGKNDTIPLALSLKESFANMMGDAEWILGSYGGLTGFGTTQGVWMKDNDKLVNADLQPQVKEGLGKIKEWIDKGYVDKEVALHNTFNAGTLFTSGQAAIIPAAYWVPRWPFAADFKDKNAVYEAFPIPTSDDGKEMHLTTSFANGGLIVNKDFDRLDALYTLMNRVYEYTDPKPGSEFEHGFADGYDYKLNTDGSVSYDLDPRYEPIGWGITPKPQLPDKELSFYSQYMNGQAQPANQIEQQWVDDKVTLNAGAVVYDQRQGATPSMYNGPDTPTMKEKGEVLKKIVMDTYTKIIYGDKPLSSFDDMVASYMNQGGDKLEQEVNDWYSKNKN